MKANKVLCWYCDGKKQVETTSLGRPDPYMADCVVCNANGFLLSIEKNALTNLDVVEIVLGER